LFFGFRANLYANQQLQAEIQAMFDSFAQFCNNLDTQSLYTLLAPDYLDDGEDSKLLINELNDEIIPAIQQGMQMLLPVLSVASVSETIVEATFQLHLGDGSDTMIETETFILKKINNAWYLYGNQNQFGAMVFTELRPDNSLRVYFKLDFNDERKIIINGVDCDSNVIEYAQVNYNSNWLPLIGRMDGDYPSFDT